MIEQIVRLFISSPGDVSDERRRVDLVVERLNAEFSGRVRIEPIRWETSYYSAHDTFQKQIPEAADCDVVLAVFRARLGTPLPDAFVRLPSGDPYPSGTAYEVLSAIEARKTGKGLPDIFVFRYPKPPSVQLDDPAETQIKEQWDRLKGFFDRWFKTQGGEFIAAFQNFVSTDDFAGKVEDCLRQWLARRGFLPQGAIWDRILHGSPFPGLAAFEADRGAVFFGRDLAIAQSIERLREAGAGEKRLPFLLIVGASGSGKSSLLRAALLPRLTLPGAIPEIDLWRTAVVTPGPNPFLSLAESLLTDAALGPELRHGAFEDAEILAKQLTGEPDVALAPLRDALRGAAERRKNEAGFEAPRAARLVLAIDQAERLFVETEPDIAGAFARLLAALTRQNLAYAIMVLRSDSYAPFQSFADLVALREAGATFDLVPPTAGELEEIVIRPVAACQPKLAFEQQDGRSLAALVAADAKGGDALPLLQMTMARLYAAEALRADGLLRFADYRGMDAAVTETANEALDTLEAEARAELPALVAGLVADVTNDPLTGKPIPIVAALDGAAFEKDNPARKKLIEAFVGKRLLTAEGDGVSRRVRPTHEALLRIWPQAVAIVKETAALLRVRRTLEPMARQWDEAADLAKQGYLELSPALLAGAQQLVARFGDDLPSVTRDFIAKAAAADAERRNRELREQEQRVRDAKSIARRTGIGLVAALVLAALAVWQWRSAETQRRTAEEAHQQAETARQRAEEARQDAERRRREAALRLAAADELIDSDEMAERLRLCMASTERVNAQPPPQPSRDLFVGRWHVDQGEIGTTDMDWRADGTCGNKGTFNRGVRARDLKSDVCTWRYQSLPDGQFQIEWTSTRFGDDYPKKLTFKMLGPNRIHNIDLNYDAFRIVCPAAELDLQRKKISALRKRAESAGATLDYQGDLASGLEGLGDILLAQGEYSAAVDPFERGLSIRQTLALSVQGDPVRQRDLALDYEKLATALKLVEPGSKTARDIFKKGLELRRGLAKAKPDNVQIQVELIYSLYWISRISDASDAKEALAEALAIAETLERQKKLSPEQLTQVGLLRSYVAGLR